MADDQATSDDGAQPHKSCFVICPIGEPGTRERLWSDDVFFHLIMPVADAHGYKARRALEASRPGEITDNIVENIIDADLLIADLTFHNANVFYELAIRHSKGKPYIHVAQAGTRIPFDVAPTNVVMIDPGTFEGVSSAKELLEVHFRSVVDGNTSFENPLTRHQHRLQARQTGDPIEKRLLALEDEFAAFRRERPAGDHSAAVARGAAGTIAPYSSISKFAEWNNSFLSSQDRKVEMLLTNNAWRFVFNPEKNRSKPITFETGGAILEGRNENEDRWRLNNGRLELLQSDGAVHSRFVYVPSNASFQHTCDPELPSMTGQRIELNR